MAHIIVKNFASLSFDKRVDSEHITAPIFLHDNFFLGAKVIKSIQYGTSKSLNDEKIGFPTLRLNEFDGFFINEAEKYCSLINLKVFESLKLEAGDVLVCRTNGNPNLVGRAAIVLDETNLAYASYLFRIKTNDKISPQSLLVYLNSKYGRSEVKRNQMISIQTNFSPEQFRRSRIPIFTIKFQNKIDKCVNAANNYRKISNSLLLQSEYLLLSELNLLVWKPKQNKTFIKKYSSTQHSFRIDAEHFQPKYDEMLDRIPSLVELFPLRKYVNYKKGIEVGGDQYTGNGKKFIRVSNLTKYGFDEQNINFISENLYDELKNTYEPQQGEILLSKDATPGIAFYLSEQPEGIISSGILRLQFINEIPRYYLELILNSIFVQLQIEKQAGGSIIIHWKPKEVMRTLIPRLNEAKEIEINNLVEQSHQQRKLSKQLIEIAKKGVEKAIEVSEAEAEIFINTELEKCEININSVN